MSRSAEWRTSYFRAWRGRINDHFKPTWEPIASAVRDAAVEAAWSEYREKSRDMAILQSYNLAEKPESVAIELRDPNTLQCQCVASFEATRRSWEAKVGGWVELWRHPGTDHLVPHTVAHRRLYYGGSGSPVPDWLHPFLDIQKMASAEISFAERECMDTAKFRTKAQLAKAYPFITDRSIPIKLFCTEETK